MFYRLVSRLVTRWQTNDSQNAEDVDSICVHKSLDTKCSMAWHIDRVRWVTFPWVYERQRNMTYVWAFNYHTRATSFIALSIAMRRRRKYQHFEPWSWNHAITQKFHNVLSDNEKISQYSRYEGFKLFVNQIIGHPVGQFSVCSCEFTIKCSSFKVHCIRKALQWSVLHLNTLRVRTPNRNEISKTRQENHVKWFNAETNDFILCILKWFSIRA